VLVLANAVHLRATWEQQVLADLTTPAPFHRADGSVVRPETMSHNEPERYAYASTDDWSAVRLPYVGDELAMWVDRSLPKWDFQSDLPLNEPLVGLGMTVPFGPDAGFSGISPLSPPIDEGIHRADITVDEKGTEAAAVTGIGFAVSGPPPADATMTVDHPFAFAIVHEPRGASLFELVVGDPTATQE